jgi:hypothetical protein
VPKVLNQARLGVLLEAERKRDEEKAKGLVAGILELVPPAPTVHTAGWPLRPGAAPITLELPAGWIQVTVRAVGGKWDASKAIHMVLRDRGSGLAPGAIVWTFDEKPGTPEVYVAWPKKPLTIIFTQEGLIGSRDIDLTAATGTPLIEVAVGDEAPSLAPPAPGGGGGGGGGGGPPKPEDVFPPATGMAYGASPGLATRVLAPGVRVRAFGALEGVVASGPVPGVGACLVRLDNGSIVTAHASDLEVLPA